MRPPPRSTLFPYTTLFRSCRRICSRTRIRPTSGKRPTPPAPAEPDGADVRSEEHTSELQSRFDLVCRLLLEKKKKKKDNQYTFYITQPCNYSVYLGLSSIF